MAKSADAFRTISEVADWLGVQTHVLRFWESKFAQVKPVKRAGGRRYYRPTDMLLLGGIRKLLHEDGLTIKGVQKILREDGVAHVADLSPPLDDETTAKLDGDLAAHTGEDVEEHMQPAALAEGAAAVPPEPDPVEAITSADPVPPPAAPAPLPSFMRTADPVPPAADPMPAPNLTPDTHPANDAQTFGGAPVSPMRTEATDAPSHKEAEAKPKPILEDHAEPQAKPGVEIYAEPQAKPGLENRAEPPAQGEPVDRAEAAEKAEGQADGPVDFEPQLQDPPAPAPMANQTDDTISEPAHEAEPAATDMPIFARARVAATPPTTVETEPVAESAAPEPKPEPEAEPAPPLRARVIDVPDDEEIDPSDLAPSALTKAIMARDLTPAQRAALHPLLAQLTALRDQMARARQDPR